MFFFSNKKKSTVLEISFYNMNTMTFFNDSQVVNVINSHLASNNQSVMLGVSRIVVEVYFIFI